MIKYSDKETAVELGDEVIYRGQLLFWKWKPGRVTYVPGKSDPHPEMEHNGLCWIGVAGNDGTFRGILVDPESNLVRSGVRFIKRNDDKDLLTPEKLTPDEW